MKLPNPGISLYEFEVKTNWRQSLKTSAAEYVLLFAEHFFEIINYLAKEFNDGRKWP